MLSLNELEHLREPSRNAHACSATGGTQSVDHLGATSHQKVAHSKDDRGGLLLPGLEGHKAHRRPLGRLADRLSISGVVLLVFQKRTSHKLPE